MYQVMTKKLSRIVFLSIFLFLFTINTLSQEFSPEFLESLPADIRSDLLEKAEEKKQLESSQYRRPSSYVKKPQTISQRFGERYFSMMQSSLMPINEPNFDPYYLLDFGDVLQIQLVGQKNEILEIPILRDGSISIPDIGKMFLSGITLEEASNLIKKNFESSFIGVDAFITLSSIRDIQILVAGNAYNPGPYTLNGNSNLFHALSVSGGPAEFGSYRRIDLIRNNQILDTIDLYKSFLYGRNSFGPRLRSGDTIFIHPSINLVSISGAIKRPGIYELEINETLEDLIFFANGVRTNADLSSVEIERVEEGNISQIKVAADEFSKQILNDEESVYIKGFSFRSVNISGAVKKPGSYRLNEGEGILELINRSGGYTLNAYPFGGILLNQDAAKIAEVSKQRLYQSFLSSLIENSAATSGSSFESIISLLNEIKSVEVQGRISAEFDLDKIISDPSLNIRLMEGDQIIIPEILDHIYIFGEISNEGTTKFIENKDINYYISSLGGMTKTADSSNIFILHPNGVSSKIKRKNLFRDGPGGDIDIYPGSIIYIPREAPNILRSETLQAYTSILGNLGVSLASISVLKD